MKISNLLLAGLAVFGLAACSNDDSIPTGPTQEEEKYDTYLKINLKSAHSQTRTEGPAATDTDGSTVSKIHVYFVNEGKIAHAFSPSITNLKVENLSVPKGEFNLVVVANPTPKMNLRTAGDINLVIKDVTEAEAEAGYYTGNKSTGFLMATAVNAPDIKKAGNKIEITDANDSKNPLKVSVEVDRASVKVNSKSQGEAVLAGEIAANTYFEKVTIDGYVLINGNQQFNLIQEWANASDKITGKYAITPFTEVTAANLDNTGYYNPFSKFAKVTVDNGKITAMEDLLKGNNLTTEATFTTENVPPFRYNKVLSSGMSQTTGVIYSTTVNEGETFYYVGGVAYTDIATVKALPDFKDMTDFPTEIAKIRTLGIKVFENGKMYYTYFIKDENNTLTYKYNDETAEVPGSKYNAVYRNSVYDITVNSIMNVGDDIPGGGKVNPLDPNPDVDPNDLFIDVSVAVKPWVLNDINIDL